MSSNIPDPHSGPLGDPDGIDWARLEQEVTEGADVVDLDAARTARRTGRSDTHFEVTLDDAPSPGGAPVDLPDRPQDGTREVVPAWLRSRPLLVATLKHTGRHYGRVAAFHTLRLPWYTAQHTFWAIPGSLRLVNRQIHWWWLSEEWELRQQAGTAGDAAMWLKLHREGKNTRLWRGIVLTAEALGLVFGAPVAFTLAPWWAGTLAVAGGILGLSKLARHDTGRTVVKPAVVTGRFRKLNTDIVLRAYYAAGLGHPDKPNQQVSFGSTMARDPSGAAGSLVAVDLPYGRGFDDAVKARGAIASGLDVAVSQVYLTRDTSSHRRHTLYVADRDPLAIPAGRTPLLDGKPRSIWDPVHLGLSERGRLVELALMWTAVLIGAQPRKGKTFTARAIALHAAMDPWVKLFGVDGKNSPDWRKFALVADAMIYGTHPSRDGDPVDQLLTLLRGIKAHINRVNEVLSGLPVDMCPEGKLTPQLARDRRFPDLRVWMLVMEEFQAYYELDDKDASAEIASLLSFIMAQGPSAGVILLSCTQKPSGIGSGQVANLFTRFRDNHTARFALKCGNRIVSEAILGSDAYAEGIDASTLPNGPEFRGIGYLYGVSDEIPTVRTFLADHADAEAILTVARRLREQAGTLSGAAAGEKVSREVRDVLVDVRGVFRPGEPGLHWQHIAMRLAATMPEVYGDASAESVSAMVRGVGVRSVDVKVDGETLKGARLAHIEAAITKRRAS